MCQEDYNDKIGNFFLSSANYSLLPKLGPVQPRFLHQTFKFYFEKSFKWYQNYRLRIQKGIVSDPNYSYAYKEIYRCKFCIQTWIQFGADQLSFGK